MKTNTILAALVLTAAASAQPQTPPPAVAPAPQAQAAPAAPAEPATPAAKPRVRTRVAVAPRAAMPALAWGGEMSGSYLGVDIDEVNADRVKALKLKEERGVEVTMVDQDAPAAKAGLKEHDVITDFNGQRVEGGEQFKRFIRETPAGRTVTLGIVRDGQPMQIKATLGDRHEEMAREMKKYTIVQPKIPQIVMPDIDIDIPAMEFSSPAVSTGIVVDNLTPQLAQFFGVKAGQGVLVKSVEKGSVAEKGGMKAGDVIVRVDNDTIESRSDYRQAIRHRGNATVKVVVIRDKKEQTLTLTLPPPRKESGWNYEFKNDWDNDSDMDMQIDFDTTAVNHMVKAFSMTAPQIKIDAHGIVDSVNSSMRDAVRHIAIEGPAVIREVY